MKSETKIKSEVSAMQKKTFAEIEEILRRYNYNEQDMIGSFVASICDVDYADMLSANNKSHVAQARWLYWMALRYFTRETYQRISERTTFDGHRFAPEGIGICITKMTELTETDEMWKRRWLTTKRMIKILRDPHDYQNSDFMYSGNQMRHKLFLQVPEGEAENYEVEIVEKNN